MKGLSFNSLEQAGVSAFGVEQYQITFLSSLSTCHIEEKRCGPCDCIAFSRIFCKIRTLKCTWL